jgi:cell division transport system ATP-binding protein
VIHLDNVTKAYPRSGPAVKDITFAVRKGEFVFLTGHSGSGKSTTLKLIHMSERPTQGEVRVSGYSSSLIADRDLWKVRRRVGCVFQDFRLLPGRSALENVAFALEVTGAPAAVVRSKSQRLLAQVGLAAKTGALHTELSGGEQQRVAVARALVNDPIVLLADEPTGNLDDRATRAVLDLFWEVNALGTAVLMATHDLELIRRYPDARVLELSEGRLVYDSAGAPAASAGAGR